MAEMKANGMPTDDRWRAVVPGRTVPIGPMPPRS
jgi:hypothetical protein